MKHIILLLFLKKRYTICNVFRESDDLASLYERIRQARENSGMTVNEVAERLGVSRVQVWRMENKAETITAERLFALADLYGVDPSKLFLGKDAGSNQTQRIEDKIVEIVTLVEREVQALNVRPAPELVADAVVEILKQEAAGGFESSSSPLDASRYQGLIQLVFK
ncbi:MAG: helix-turn-helix transcriptional regulator [Pseudomonadota bacterium]